MNSKNAILPLVLAVSAIAQEQPTQPGLRTPEQPAVTQSLFSPGRKYR